MQPIQQADERIAKVPVIVASAVSIAVLAGCLIAVALLMGRGASLPASHARNAADHERPFSTGNSPDKALEELRGGDEWLEAGPRGAKSADLPIERGMQLFVELHALDAGDVVNSSSDAGSRERSPGDAGAGRD